MTTLVFIGRFQPASFAEFIRHRAARLSIDVGTQVAHPERFEVVVSGEENLVDAFEVACSLGPLDCLVLDNFRRNDGH
jgi:acylphosphatase